MARDFASYEYDFPVASTSALPSTTKPRHHHVHSHKKPHWESHHHDESAVLDDDLDVDDIDYDAYGYPYPAHHTHRAMTIPTVTRTGNQWTQRPPSPQYAYSAAYLYPYSAGGYPYALPGSSVESDKSALSTAMQEKKEKKGLFCHTPKEEGSSAKKIRKSRRSTDSAPAAVPTFAHSDSSDSYLSPDPYALDDASSSLSDDPASYVYDDENYPYPEDDEENAAAHDGTPSSPSSSHSGSMALKRQWAALSMRVQFGVFRAKRKMRNRVMSM